MPTAISPIGSATASSSGRRATSRMPSRTTAARTLGSVASLTPGVSQVAMPNAIAEASDRQQRPAG